VKLKDEAVRMWDLRSSGILCDVDWYFCTDDSAQIIGPIFKASILKNLPSKPATWTILSTKGPRLHTTPCLGQSWKPLIHFKNKKYSFGDTYFPALQSLQCHLHPNLLYNLPLLPLINFPACYPYKPGHIAVPLLPLAWYSICLPFPSCI